LSKAQNELVPVTIDDETITIERDALPANPERRMALSEEIADKVVKTINGLLGIQTRKEIFY